MNKNSSVKVISPGFGWFDEEIKHCGKDVTSIYLSGGAGNSSIEAFNNPWLVTIVGGIMVVIFGALIL